MCLPPCETPHVGVPRAGVAGAVVALVALSTVVVNDAQLSLFVKQGSPLLRDKDLQEIAR